MDSDSVLDGAMIDCQVFFRVTGLPLIMVTISVLVFLYALGPTQSA